MVALRLKKPVLPEDDLVGTKAHGWPPRSGARAVHEAGGVSRVTMTRAATNPSRHTSSRSQCPPPDEVESARTMPIRSSRLPKNQSAGCVDATPLRTVHQRPPKKIAPRAPPASPASASVNVSFIVILLLLPHRLVFLGHPMPRIQTAEGETGHQQRQRPGPCARMASVQPEAERRAEQRRNDHRPADRAPSCPGRTRRSAWRSAAP